VRHPTPEDYKDAARRGLSNPVLQAAMADIQNRLGPATALAYQALPEGPGLRDTAHDLRMAAIENLDILLAAFAERVREHGGHVLYAPEAQTAVAHVLDIAQRHAVRRIVKGKSMLSEEIGLNPALIEAGIEVMETDLGEYIVQLAGDRPSHILGPAMHMTRREIGALFAQHLGIPYSEDPPTLTLAARRALRDKFFKADMGISGCNLACAETGHITILSNEGNVRMATTLPKVHVALMGMERIAARLEDHDVLLRLLSTGATSQKMATYVSYVGGPRSPDFEDGPEHFYVVIVDNGRSRILADPVFREILCCIRCSACLNVCPIYRKIGGHAYGSIYSGPIGAVITPLLWGIERGKHLCQGETLCGACEDACPVHIRIPKLLLELRARLAEGDPAWETRPAPIAERLAYKAWARMACNPRVYHLFMQAASFVQRLLPRRTGMIRRLPAPFDGWTLSRNMPPLARRRFLAGSRSRRAMNPR